MSAPSWQESLADAIDYAFQPIVNIHTGVCYGVEALMRGHDKLGFDTVHDLLDTAYQAGDLHNVETTLREIAIAKFAEHMHGQQVRLFLNLDNRVLMSPDYRSGQTAGLLDRHGIPPHMVCLELSERHEITPNGVTETLLRTYRGQSFRLAIDDFGTGYAGMKLLYDQHPDYIKIDRYFIAGIPNDAKKKVVVSTIASLSHVFGIKVVAEGVETEQEFLTCREIGCDMVQGYLVQRPTLDLKDLHLQNRIIATLSTQDRRRTESDAALINAQIEPVPALPLGTPMDRVLECFREDKSATFFPVVDESGDALGLIREESIKELAYSPFGKELIRNKAFDRSLRDFITPLPAADIRTEAEKILETFTLNENPNGIIITDNFKYVGILSARSLLRLMNEKNLAIARDQNPLSRLPGNNLIADYSKAALVDTASARTVVYFDFNSFKPFNDHYGYRQGDRAITLFADLMRKGFGAGEHFLGHIGGDDFFLAMEGLAREEAETRVRDLLDKFASQVESFYDAEARNAGGIVGKDRDGNERHFPLMTVAAAIVHLPAGREPCTLDALTGILARMKKQAKQDETGVAVATLACRCPI